MITYVFPYYNFVYLFLTFRKADNRGFHVIDPLNEQHIVIIEESHDWPNIFLSGHTVYISFSTSTYILETGGIEKVLAMTEAKVENSSAYKESTSKSGAFSSSGKSSFSHGTFIRLLLEILLSNSCCSKLSWPEKKMVANGTKHQFNTLPNCTKRYFFPSVNGRDT